MTKHSFTRPVTARRIALSAWAAAGFCAMLAALSLTAAQARPASGASRSSIPPYCVLRGGSDGAGSGPQDCRYFDYQQCLQAAASMRGNCVVNIDYPYRITNAPGAAWSQP